MSVHAINHPLVQHKLGLMRAAGISTKSFRELASKQQSQLADLLFSILWMCERLFIFLCHE